MEDREFAEEAAAPTVAPDTAELQSKAQSLGTIGWALFFIWVGIAFLADFGVGIGLLGIGIITLAMQIARKSSGLNLEWFWVLVGLLFLLGGIWDISKPDVPLIPILLILAGVILLISIGMGKRKPA